MEEQSNEEFSVKMRSRIALIIIFAMPVILFHGQKPGETDSLKNILSTDISDTLRYSILKSLSFKIYSKDLDQALGFGDKALELEEKLDLPPDPDFHNHLVYLNDHSGNYERSARYLEKFVEKYGRRATVMDKINFYKYSGWLNLRKGEYMRAVEFYSKALELIEKEKLDDEYEKTLYSIARVYETIGDFEKQMEYYQKYLEHVDWDEKAKYVSYIYLNIGDIQREVRKDYNQAAESYQIALDLAYQTADSSQINTVLNHAAWNYYVMGDLEKSLDFYLKNLEVCQALDNKYYINNCFGNMGNIYRDWGDYDLAIEYYNKSIDIASEIGDMFNLAWLYEDISKMYAKQGDYESAYRKAMLHAAYNDSALTGEYSRSMLAARTRYADEKKARELELLKVKLQRNRLFSYGLGGTSLLVIIIGLLFIAQNRLKAKQRLEAMNLKLSELNQQNLRQQMNPHFIFNTLNSIQYFVFQNDKISANNYMSKFAKLIRKTLENSQNPSIPIKEEIEALEIYLELEALRFKDKFDWRVTVDEEIDTLLYKIPTMLIQPYAENSIVHGLMHKDGKGLISVDLNLQEDIILVTIEDNGIGRSQAMEIKKKKNDAHNSLGTSITESRLKLVNSLYGKSMQVVYTDLEDENGEPAGTRVEIKVPVMG